MRHVRHLALSGDPALSIPCSLLDARGQRFPNQQVLKPTPIRICDADIYGTLEPLNIHGPLFTSYLVAFASHFRATPRYTRNRLGDFYTSTDITHLGTAAAGPILDRPEGQFPSWKKARRNGQ